MTYVTPEPERVNGFEDQNGQLHPSRDTALEANFCIDLRNAIGGISAPRADHNFEACLRHFARTHPDMMRILIGDRDLT